MSEKVVGHVKVYALDLTDELIKGKGVASKSGQSVATREIGQRHWKNRMKMYTYTTSIIRLEITRSSQVAAKVFVRLFG